MTRQVQEAQRTPFPFDWLRVRLEEICKFRHGGTPSKANPSFWEGSIPWVSPKDMRTDFISDTQDHISEEAIAQSSTSTVPENTLLAVVRSGILARTLPLAVTGRTVAFNQDIKAILPDFSKVDLWFLYWAIRQQEPWILLNGVKKRATVHSLRADCLEALETPLPPLPEQQRIATILNEQMAAVERARAAAEAQLAAITALPTMLLHRAFNGGL